MMPSFKNTASIFPEISFIQYFTIFSCKQYDVIVIVDLSFEYLGFSNKWKDTILIPSPLTFLKWAMYSLYMYDPIQGGVKTLTDFMLLEQEISVVLISHQV